MIIDLNTQIWLSVDQLGPEIADRLRTVQIRHWGQLDASPAAHERAMDCVDGSIVLGFRSELLEARIPNEYIADFVARDPRRRIGVAGIDPMSDDAIDQLDAAAGLGLSGVAISPACQGFHPVHSLAMRVYERCTDASMPLFVTLNAPLTATSQLEFARPALWDEVARAFPQMPIVISQLGHPWIDETLLLLGKHSNIWADISGVASRPWQLYNALLNALSFGVMEKLLFGSGFPHELPARTIESLYSINSFSHGTQLPAIPRAHVRGIVERDAIRCLGLDAVIPARYAVDRENGEHEQQLLPERVARRLPGRENQDHGDE
jgi:predicted TIM-barrel fold metal-dependent hydrolase